MIFVMIEYLLNMENLWINCYLKNEENVNIVLGFIYIYGVWLFVKVNMWIYYVVIGLKIS